MLKNHRTIWHNVNFILCSDFLGKNKDIESNKKEGNKLQSLHDIKLSVMTWNIYLGADLTPILAPGPEPLPQRVTEIFHKFLATDIPRRARAIAYQIFTKKPDIIGLQEAEIWELIPPNCHKTEYDFVTILLHILECWGMKYKIAAQNYNVKVALPDNTGNIISLTDRDVILIRDWEYIEVTQKQEANFKTNLQLEIAGQPLTILRGWSAIDACFCEDPFRIVNTHLEPNSPDVQLAQADELLEGPWNTNLPLIFIGDFNSPADGTGTATYKNLIAAGFKDAWIEANGGDNGFTCCQNADLLNPHSLLNERIDLILLKNKPAWNVVKADLIGEKEKDRTCTGLWPSDHAGVISKLKFEC